MNNEKRGASAFVKCGQTLYGPNWKNPFKGALGDLNQKEINSSTFRDWINGKKTVPDGIWLYVIELLKQRQLDIDDVLRGIK
jgi:hypothetical protein